MRKKLLYGTICVALSAMLIGCGDTVDSKNDVTEGNSTTQSSPVDAESEKTDDATETSESKSNLDFKDVSTMSYDEAAAYLDTLPESPAEDFTIVSYDDYDETGTLSEGECYIQEYKGSDSIVVVPEQINGYSVICVGGNSFSSNKSITAVRLPKSTRIIKAFAFTGCSNLSIVTGLDCVEQLGDACFSTSSPLRIKFTDSVTSSDEYIYNASGEVYVKKGSFLAGDDYFGFYGETDENSYFQVIYY